MSNNKKTDSIFSENAKNMSPEELRKIQRAFVKDVNEHVNMRDAKRIVVLAFMMLGWEEEQALKIYIRITKELVEKEERIIDYRMGYNME